jgi:hypothetical protein
MSYQPKFQLPWTYQLSDEQPEGDLQLFHIVFGDDEGCVASVWGEEQAQRIVACVSACDGIPTKALQSGLLDDIGEALRQRDALLAALKSTIEHVDFKHEAYATAYALIAETEAAS